MALVGPRPRLPVSRLFFLPFAASLLAACGAGTGAALSGGGSGGTSNAPTVISAFRVVDPTTGGAPRGLAAELRFVLSDPEGDTARVEFVYEVPGQAPQSLAWIQTVPPTTNPATLSTTPEGREYALYWAFASEPLLPPDGSFTPDVRVYALVQGSNVIVAGANAATLGLGNDLPVISVETPPVEVDGVVPIRLQLSDSAVDPHDVRIEFDVLGDTPDAGWRSARPGGLPNGSPTPDPAFVDVLAGPTGVTLVFFWDTDVDLADLERDVRLRVTPSDPEASGRPALTGVFRVDNNATPAVQIQEGAFLSSPDTARGIPLPFTVIDEESDPVMVAFQWRREDEPFPVLPASPTELSTILQDPVLREAHKICEPYPREYALAAQKLDDLHLRLPELRSTASYLLHEGLEGRELVFHRPSHHLECVSTDWAASPLVQPVAALPFERGTRALCLDATTADGFALLDVDLNDGGVRRTLAIGPGTPTALCFERGETAVLIGSTSALGWELRRVVLATGEITLVARASDGVVESGPIRGLASLGTNASVATVGSSLIKMTWAPSTPTQVGNVRTGLHAPEGVVLDPRATGHVYVAEREAPGGTVPGRIVSIEIATQSMREIAVQPSPDDGLAFPRPRGIALVQRGTSLQALCEPVPGKVVLRTVVLGRSDINVVRDVGPLLDGNPSALSSGKEDAVVAVASANGSVHVAGGLRAAVRVQAFDLAQGAVTLEAPLTVPEGNVREGRVQLGEPGPRSYPSSSAGTKHVFTWNSEQARGGRVHLRALCHDSEPGLPDATSGAKLLPRPFEATEQTITTSFGHLDTFSVDLDLDGDEDLVSAAQTDSLFPVVRVHWQTSPGEFDPRPLVIGDPGACTPGCYPIDVQSTDIDGDGLLDLIWYDPFAQSVQIHRQIAPGSFAMEPWSLAGMGPLSHLRAGDLDSDGDVDLVGSTPSGGSSFIVALVQAAVGTFPSSPLAVSTGPIGGRVADLQLADVDGNGSIDVVCALGDTSVDGCVLWQVSKLVFAYPPTWLGIGLSIYLGDEHRIRIGDIGGEGRLDVLHLRLGRARVYQDLRPGTPAAAPSHQWSVWGPDGEIADLDGDGLADIVFSDGGVSPVEIAWGDRNGGLPTTVDPAGGPSSNQVWAIDLADLDADGRLDLVTARPNTLTGAALYLQPRPNRSPLLATELGTPHATAACWPADLDSDGDLDLVASELQRLRLHHQVGPGTFDLLPATWSFSPASFLSGVVTADCDLDGDQDLLTRAGSLFVIPQTGPGQYSAQAETVGGGLRPLDLVDLDLDGDLDILSVDFDGGLVLVSWQLGPMQFSPAPVELFRCCPLDVDAGDLDSDGDLDLVSANHDANSIDVFWQVSTGVFDSVPTSFATPAPRSIQIVDVDDDGDLDLVHTGDAGASAILQTSRGSFLGAPSSLGFPGLGLALRIVDFDADGRLDALVDSRVHWGTTAGLFEFFGDTSMGLSSVRGRHFLDLDADGELDVVSPGPVVHWGGLR